jgi:AraC family L-rhamnose operon regulatory protein RhaS
MFTLKRKDRFHHDDFPIAVERRDPQEHFELKARDSYEIVIVVGGRAFHVTRRNSRPLAAGDVLIVGGSEVHQYREIKDLHLINILFRPDKLHMELLDLSGVPGYQALFLV